MVATKLLDGGPARRDDCQLWQAQEPIRCNQGVDFFGLENRREGYLGVVAMVLHGWQSKGSLLREWYPVDVGWEQRGYIGIFSAVDVCDPFGCVGCGCGHDMRVEV